MDEDEHAHAEAYGKPTSTSAGGLDAGEGYASVRRDRHKLDGIGGTGGVRNAERTGGATLGGP